MQTISYIAKNTLILILILCFFVISIFSNSIKTIYAASSATAADSSNSSCPKSMTITAHRRGTDVSVTASWKPGTVPAGYKDNYGYRITINDGSTPGLNSVAATDTTKDFDISSGKTYKIIFSTELGVFGTSGVIDCGTLYVDATSNTATPTVSATPITPPPGGGGTGGGTGGGGSTGNPGGYVSSSTAPACPQNVRTTAVKSGTQVKITLKWDAPTKGTTGGLNYTVTRMVKNNAPSTFTLDKTQSPGAAFPTLEDMVDSGKIYGYVLKADYSSGDSCTLGVFEVNTLSMTPVVSITNGSTMPSPPASGGSSGSTAGADCEAKCPQARWFSISESIQKAMCQMQCTIINWEASVISWVVGGVLYPALGLD